MLALTKKTDYALIALTYLARRTGHVVNAREIASVTRVPLPILTNILKRLAATGIVVSERGVNGGYGLGKAPEYITLHELITAIEGPFQFVQCLLSSAESHRAPCELEASCPIRLPAMRVHDRLRSFLQGVTVADLIDHEQASGSVRVGAMLQGNLSHSQGLRKEFA